MGSVQRRVKCFREDGQLELAFGRHDIEIANREFDIDDVYVSCPMDEFPVCQGNLNWISVTILEHGFIIHADINTSSAVIRWTAIGSLGNKIIGN